MKQVQGVVVVVLIGLCIYCSVSSALVKPFRLTQLQVEAKLQDFPAQWKTTTLDHFNPLDTRTFRQRWWVNDLYWNKPNGPVILYINGEGPVSGPPQSADDEVVILAKDLGALIVTLEHRYYGNSQPFSTISTENLQFLSSRQALNDLADFIAYIQKNMLQDGSQKWFTVGGSYSGALSAWFRLKFPHLTQGSIASSGVVHAILDFTAFDKQVATSVGPVCAAVLRSVTQALEHAIIRGSHARKVQTLALFNAQNLTINGDFFYFAGDAMATSVQYGFQDDLCNPLLAAKRNGADLVAAFANFTNSFWVPVFGPPEQYSTAYQASIAVAPERNYRPWWFQKCTEFAWFQTAPAQGSIRSSIVNLDYHKQHCKALFGADLWPNVNETNEYYGGAEISATNVIYVDGSQDPWQHASVLQSLSGSEPALVIKCHNCGHCVDLGGCPGGCQPPSALTDGRKIITQYVKKWMTN